MKLFHKEIVLEYESHEANTNSIGTNDSTEIRDISTDVEDSTEIGDCSSVVENPIEVEIDLGSCDQCGGDIEELCTTCYWMDEFGNKFCSPICAIDFHNMTGDVEIKPILSKEG